MLDYTTQYPDLKDTLMKMLYLFLLSKAKPISKRNESIESNGSPDAKAKINDI